MNSFQRPSTPKEDFRAIRIFFNAIVAGPFIMTAIVIFLDSQSSEPGGVSKSVEKTSFVIAAAIAITCFIAAKNIYQKGITYAKDPLIPLPDKLKRYRTALINYLALCEAPALIGIIGFFISGNYYFFTITAVMIASMISKAPSRKRLVRELELDHRQEQELE